MKKATIALLVGLGLMVASTSTLSAGCGCPTFHFGCKKHKVVKKVKKVKRIKRHKAKRSCGFHIPSCYKSLFSCKK